MTFKNLKKHKEEDKNNYSAISDTTETASIAEDKKQPFDNELLYGQWMSMCMRMQGINELYGLSQRLKMLTPKITDYPSVEIVIDNPILLDQIGKIKNRIRSTLVLGLHNDDIVINYRVAKQAEIGKIRNKREIFDDMKKKNPALDKLVQEFKLVMA